MDARFLPIDQKTPCLPDQKLMPATNRHHTNMRSALIMLIFGFLALAIAFGVRSSFGLYIGPLHEQVGFSIATLSIVFAVQNLMWGIAQPIAGAWADTKGATPVMVIGGLTYALGIVLMATSEDIVLFGIGGGVMCGFAIAALGFPVVSAAIGRKVPPEKRSLFFGISTAGGSFGQAVFAPGASQLIESFGLHNSLLVLAAICLCTSALAFGLIKDRPGRKVVTHDAKDADDQGERFASIRQIVHDAVRDRGYWLLTMGFFVCGFQLAYITIHLPPYLVLCGLSHETGALAISLIGITNVIGTVFAGYIGGLIQPKFPLASIYLLRALATALFITLTVTKLTTILFAIVMGFLWLSTIPLTIGVIVRMYGTRYVATLYGIVFFSHQLGSFVGLMIAGWTFEATGHYDLVWWISIILGLLAAIIHLPIDDRQRGIIAPMVAARS